MCAFLALQLERQHWKNKMAPNATPADYLPSATKSNKYGMASLKHCNHWGGQTHMG